MDPTATPLVMPPACGNAEPEAHRNQKHQAPGCETTSASGEVAVDHSGANATVSTSTHSTAPRLEQPTGRSLFVEGLALNVQYPQLYDLFSRFGTVVSCRVLHDAKRGLSRGIGYINFATADEAARALTMLNNEERASIAAHPHLDSTKGAASSDAGRIGGVECAKATSSAKPLSVKYANHDPNFAEDDARALAVHFVPLGVDRDAVSTLFGQFGTVVACELALSTDSRQPVPKSAPAQHRQHVTQVARVEFKSAAEATKAAAKVHGTTPHGGTIPLYVKPAESENRLQEREEKLGPVTGGRRDTAGRAGGSPSHQAQSSWAPFGGALQQAGGRRAPGGGFQQQEAPRAFFTSPPSHAPHKAPPLYQPTQQHHHGGNPSVESSSGTPAWLAPAAYAVGSMQQHQPPHMVPLTQHTASAPHHQQQHHFVTIPQQQYAQQQQPPMVLATAAGAQNQHQQAIMVPVENPVGGGTVMQPMTPITVQGANGVLQTILVPLSPPPPQHQHHQHQHQQQHGR